MSSASRKKEVGEREYNCKSREVRKEENTPSSDGGLKGGDVARGMGGEGLATN